MYHSGDSRPIERLAARFDGPIGSIASPSWNRRQFYSVRRVNHGHRQTLAANLACPPCNIGPASTPTNAMSASSVIGVWTAASRRRSLIRETGTGLNHERRSLGAGVAPGQPAVQRGDRAAGRQGPWNSLPAQDDAQFVHYVAHPELASLGTRYLPHFPYLGTPVGGYQTKPLRAA